MPLQLGRKLTGKCSVEGVCAACAQAVRQCTFAPIFKSIVVKSTKSWASQPCADFDVC